MTSIEKHHGGIVAAYDAQLSLPWLALSPNEPGVVGWYLDTEMLSQMLMSSML